MFLSKDYFFFMLPLKSFVALVNSDKSNFLVFFILLWCIFNITLKRDETTLQVFFFFFFLETVTILV